MRQKQEKNVFLNTLKVQIKHREMLQAFYNTSVWAIVAKFDGKVYNKRFDNALNEALQAIDPLMSATCTFKGRDSYSNFPNNNKVEIHLSCRLDTFNYSDKESLWFNLVLDSDGRICCENSKNEKYTIAWVENFVKDTEEQKTIIKGYDEYLKVAQKVADSISEFKDLPSRFRRNIEFTTLFYLKS